MIVRHLGGDIKVRYRYAQRWLRLQYVQQPQSRSSAGRQGRRIRRRALLGSSKALLRYMSREELAGLFALVKM